MSRFVIGGRAVLDQLDAEFVLAGGRVASTEAWS